MPPGDADESPVAGFDGSPSIQCSACDAALESSGREAVSFLLVDQLKIPIVGCDDHLELFGSVCEFTTEDSVTLLDHIPAGGVPCPACRLAPHNPQQPIVAVEGGALAVLACPTHQADIIDRYRTGLETRQQLSAPLDAF